MTGKRDNFSGDIELTAPSGGVTAGKAYTWGATTVVARTTADAGAKYLAAVKGVLEASKTAGSGRALTAGNLCGFTSGSAVASGSGITNVARVMKDAAAAADTVLIDLNP